MRISEIKNKPMFSIEVFPPRAGVAVSTIYDTVDALTSLPADFVSVTYGAGGSASKNTMEVARRLREHNKVLPLPHFTSADIGYADADAMLQTFSESGFENVLALRGDLPDDPGFKRGAFGFAADFIKYLRSKSDLCIGAATYPEGHSENRNPENEAAYMERKLQSGADFFITQLFFDNDVFFDYLDKVRKRNINSKVLAGIMPVVQAKSILRIIRLCGVSVPAELSRIVSCYGDNDSDMEKAGMEYAVRQINGLLEYGVDGVHLYCMNRPKVARQIYNNSNLRRCHVQNN